MREVRVLLRSGDHPLVYDVKTGDDLTNRCADIVHWPGPGNNITATIYKVDKEGLKYIDKAQQCVAYETARVVVIEGGLDDRGIL